MHGSRSKIPSKNLVMQRCAEGFNSGVKVLNVIQHFKVFGDGVWHLHVLPFLDFVHRPKCIFLNLNVSEAG
jgi:hypothetical protein